MASWNVTFTLKTGAHTHRVPKGRGHALLYTTVASAFETLGVSAGITTGDFWWPIYTTPSVMAFEVEHGREADRQRYNGRLIARARRRCVAVRGTHAGFSDLFVPIQVDGEVEAVLVVGPFLLARPTSRDIAERWRKVTGRRGHLLDPAFGSYVRGTLRTLVLDRDYCVRFERLMACLAGLLSGQGDADALANEAELLIVDVRETRSVERVWEHARSMVDDRFPSAWTSAGRRSDLYNLGLDEAPDQALVGLCVSRTPRASRLVELVNRDGLQRAVVEFARKNGDLVAGRVGDHGVFFLSCAPGSIQRKRQRLSDWAERIAQTARRDFGQTIHFGASIASATTLSFGYQRALAAAEAASAQGDRIVFSDSYNREGDQLSELRRALARDVDERPELTAARFQRYVQAVAVRAGENSELASLHLETGFERLTEALSQSGALSKKSVVELGDRLKRQCASASSASELVEIYLEAVKGLGRATEAPASARQDQGLERAITYVQEHYADALSLPKVARVAGFAPAHFSRLFGRRMGAPLVAYVASLRLERAKQLLASTDFDVTQVAERSGFRSVQYFCRVFRRSVRASPLEFRRTVQTEGFKRPHRNTQRKSSKYKAGRRGSH